MPLAWDEVVGVLEAGLALVGLLERVGPLSHKRLVGLVSVDNSRAAESGVGSALF